MGFLLRIDMSLPYIYPPEQPRSPRYTLRLNGMPIDVLHTRVADFTAFDWATPVEAEVTVSEPFSSAVLRPLGRGIPLRIEGHTIRFPIDRPQNLCLEVVGQPELFLYANPPERNRPSPADPGVRFFEAGKIHDVGRLELHAGETLYIEGGAVLRGALHATDAHGLRIAGRGILDGSCYSRDRGDHIRSVILEHSNNLHIEDVILINPNTWMLVLGNCEDVEISNLKEIGEVMSSDGIDIVGSRRVHITGCCLRNNDDNVVVKSLDIAASMADPTRTWCHDATDILVEDCVLWNAPAGNAMEIGHELRTTRIANVTFRNIDVLCVHGHGAVFSIHNGDRALVENILWEDIRIEHHYDKFIDFRVIKSRYSQDKVIGRIRNVRLKNILVHESPFNAGYTISLISGLDASKPTEDVVIENLFYHDRKITAAEQIDLHTRHARGIEFH
jgi:hypothetical protein